MMNPVLPALLFLAAAGAQESRLPDGAQVVRVYLIDRQNPDRVPEDAAVSMTLQSRSGRGDTLLLVRVPETPESSPAPEAIPGMIRRLVGSSFYVELFWSARPPLPAERNPEQHSPTPSAPSSAGGGPLPAGEVLRRAHRGPCFVAVVPSSRIADVRSATLTVRLGSSTWTSEEFQGPALRVESEEAAMVDLERALRTVQQRTAEGASFMMLKPAAENVIRALAKLAPFGFRDSTGVFEQDRQWCLGVARAIVEACDLGNWGRMHTLSLGCGPRVKRMQSLGAPLAPEIPSVDQRD